MTLATLSDFFFWCTIINGGLLLFWTMFCILAPDLLYRLQNRWFPLPRESFDPIIYAFLGLFKILVLFFNLVPYVALQLIP